MIIIFLLLLLLSTGLTVRPDTSILYSRIGLLIIIYSIISALMSFHMTYLGSGIGLYGGLFNATCITHTFQIFILLVSGIILLMTAFYPRKKFIGESTTLMNVMFKKVKQYTNIINKMSEQFSIIEYSLIIIFVVTGATLLISCADFVSIYLCLELQSFSLYIISAMHRNSESSTGSALTYFLLGGLSSCFILLGISLIYANTGLTSTDTIYTYILSTPEASSEDMANRFWYPIRGFLGLFGAKAWIMYPDSSSFIFYSLLLISVGFLFKIAAAPFHWWSPDVYDGVPTIVTTFIAILGKISILIIFLELVHYTYIFVPKDLIIISDVPNHRFWDAGFNSWQISLTFSCFFSLIIGTVLGLTQTRIKKLLAYSTISHIGFILLALISRSVESYQAYLFYIMQYILTNLTAFLSIIGIGFSLYLYFTNISEYNNLSEKNNSPIQLISQLKGYFSINPVIALCLVITMLSFVGLPPLVGFFAKQVVLMSALDTGYISIALIAVITSVIGAVYYLNVIKTIYFDNAEYEKSYVYVEISLSNYLSIAISLLTLLVFIFILTPNEPLNLCNLLSVIAYLDENSYLTV